MAGFTEFLSDSLEDFLGWNSFYLTIFKFLPPTSGFCKPGFFNLWIHLFHFKTELDCQDLFIFRAEFVHNLPGFVQCPCHLRHLVSNRIIFSASSSIHFSEALAASASPIPGI